MSDLDDKNSVTSCNQCTNTTNSKTDKAGDKLHVAIIGTGSGAFAAAIKSVEEGAAVTIIEGAEDIGGTCVNVGCVPSKIFIQAAYIAHLQGCHEFDGITLNTPAINRKAMLLQQQAWVEKLRYAKYESILENNAGISLVRGMAKFKDAGTLIVTDNDNQQTEIKADRVLIATGASATVPAIKGLKETPYWTSTAALQTQKIPEHLIVIGASVIALELAQAFSHLGSKVSVIARSQLLSKQEPEIGKALAGVFTEQGINVLLNTTIETVSYSDNEFTLQTSNGEITGDQLLIATGRSAKTKYLNLEKVGVKTDKSGNIIIDEHMQTNVDNIYAAGDCTNQPQYVYVAAAAGTRAARNMTQNKNERVSIDLSIIPSVVFTHPQAATVGLSEHQAIEKGIEVSSRQLDLENVPRALANMDTTGFIKLVADQKTETILGCQVVAESAGEVIQSASLAIKNEMTVTELADQLFPYLTMVEGLKLCAQTFNKDVSQLSCCAG